MQTENTSFIQNTCEYSDTKHKKHTQSPSMYDEHTFTQSNFPTDRLTETGQFWHHRPGKFREPFKSVRVEWMNEKPVGNKSDIHINEAPGSGEGSFVLNSPVCIILPF